MRKYIIYDPSRVPFCVFTGDHSGTWSTDLNRAIHDSGYFISCSDIWSHKVAFRYPLEFFKYGAH